MTARDPQASASAPRCASAQGAHNRAMASRRRDRGRRPRGGVPVDIQGTLGTLLRTTLHQVGVVKEAVERQARSSLGQLDSVMMERRRRDALARLGEAVWNMARDGELGALAGHPEVAGPLGELAELEEHTDQAGAPAAGVVSSADWRPPAPAAGPAGGRRGEPMRVWRPVVPGDEDETAHDQAPEEPARPRDEPAEARDLDPAPSGLEPADPDGEVSTRAARSPRRRRSRRRDSDSAGGIAFVADGPDDEDDLRAYMHDDDVPGD